MWVKFVIGEEYKSVFNFIDNFFYDSKLLDGPVSIAYSFVISVPC